MLYRVKRWTRCCQVTMIGALLWGCQSAYAQERVPTLMAGHALRPTAPSLVIKEQPPLTLAPKGLTTKERYDYYARMLKDLVGEPSGDDVWVIGLRGLDLNGELHDSDRVLNSNQEAVIMVDPKQDKAWEYRGSTLASGSHRAQTLWGTTWLRPGVYRAMRDQNDSATRSWKLSDRRGQEDLPVWTDRDEDGVLSEEERTFDEFYRTKAKGVRFTATGEASELSPRSDQRVSAEDSSAFIAALSGRSTFHYLLIDAARPTSFSLQDKRPLHELSHPLSPLDSFRYYEGLAAEYGISPNFRQLVVVLRGMNPQGERHDSGDNMGPYNDCFLVLSRKKGKNPTIEAYLGSSHAGQASTSLSPGCYAGIAQVRPGRYYARSNDLYHGLWSWHIVNDAKDRKGKIPAFRDRDKDGVISLEEMRWAKRYGTTADEILIHNGVAEDVGNSIGCLTLPPDVMTEFITHLGKGSEFPVLILDANASADELTF